MTADRMLRAWRSSRVQVGLDVVLAVVLLVIGQIEIRTDPEDGYSGGPLLVNAVVCVLVAVPVAVRHVRPLPAWTVQVVGLTVADLAFVHGSYFWSTGVPVLLTTYAVARRCDGAWTRWVWLPASLALALDAVRLREALDPLGWVTITVSTAACTVAGITLRANADRRDRLAATLEEVAEEIEAAERDAALTERRRIAVEVDDLLGHVLGEMVLQTTAARLGLEEAGLPVPSQVVAAEQTGRRALGELAGDLGSQRRPLPGIGDLDVLVAGFVEAGLPVTLTVGGDLPSVPPALQVSVYRVVQESLTNVLKHASGAETRVSVSCGEGAVLVDVLDGGGRPTAGLGSGGQGLTGMRTRVGVFGGDLDAGPLEGGFRVRARLPLGVDVHGTAAQGVPA